MTIITTLGYKSPSQVDQVAIRSYIGVRFHELPSHVVTKDDWVPL